MRSLARALSSSRRPPPNAASNLCVRIAVSSVTACWRLRLPVGPGSGMSPLSMLSCTEATTNSRPYVRTNSSLYSITSGKLWPVSTCMTGNGKRAGANALMASHNNTAESFPPENSNTGDSHPDTTSLMIVIASDSRRSRCDRLASISNSFCDVTALMRVS